MPGLTTSDCPVDRGWLPDLTAFPRDSPDDTVRQMRLLLTSSVVVAFSPQLVQADKREPDPFAHEYAVPKSSEVGTTAGQVRVFSSAGGQYDEAPQLFARPTLEVMTIPQLGFQWSSIIAIGLDEHDLVGSVLGSTLHFLPYRRLDLSAGFAGGAALINPFSDERQWTPVVVTTLALDVWLSSYWFLRAESGSTWTKYSVDAAPASNRLVPYFTLGIGLGL